MNNYGHQVSKQLNVSVPTLHYYEKMGLLPKIERDQQNRRIYHEADIEWIKMIVLLRGVGIPIKVIKQYTELVTEGTTTVDARIKLLADYKTLIQNQIEKLTHLTHLIDEKIDFYAQHGADDSLGFIEKAKMFRKQIGIE